MRLKSLKLAGFKSFANPTTFTFRHGITAIVGPNGCGKSNVIDAIRWVLGESSAKQLRGGAMSDVIFAGTQHKAAKSVASVELTFEHTQDEQTGIRHELNLYHELSVRRQINVEGKSDYFINGTRCRRRDVVDVFLGTGLGPRSYSVIQQGMIGRIVDSSPQQLREFIEEAAGVSRYQARREETQKKLLKTKENLERLNDIEAELSRQKKKLVKQAESANHYQKIQQQLAAVKEQLAVHQLCQAKASQMQHKANEEQLTKSVTALQQQHAQLKTKLNKLSDRLAQEQWLKDDARDKLHVEDLQRQQLEHQLKTLQADINQLDGRRHANLERQKRTENLIIEARNEQQQQAEAIALITPKIKELEQRQHNTQQAYTPLQASLTEIGAETETLDQQKRQLEQQIALDKQAESRVQQDLTKWQNQQDLWQQEAEKWGMPVGQDSTANSAKPNFDNNAIQALSELEGQLSGLLKQQETLTESLEAEQPVLNQLSQAVNAQQTQLAKLENQQASLIAEYETLHSIVYPKKGQKIEPDHSKTNTSQALESTALSGAAQHNATVTTLNDLSSLHQKIKLSKEGEQYAPLLDRWLAFWLDSRILDGVAAKEGDESEISHQLLSALITPEADLSLDKRSKSAIKQHHNKNNNPDESQVEPQANSVLFTTSSDLSPVKSINPQLIPLPQLISAPKLSFWQQCYLHVVDNTNASWDQQKQTITELIGQLPHSALVLTVSGWLMGHFGAIHLSKLEGDSQNSQFLTVRLQQQQRLASLEDKLNEIEEQIDTLAKSLKSNQLKKEQTAVFVEELNAQISSLTHNTHTLKQQQIEFKAKQDRQFSEQQRLIQQREQLQADHEQLQQELIKLRSSIEQTNKVLVEINPKLLKVKDKQQQLEKQRQVIAQQEREEADMLRHLQLDHNKAELADKHSQQQLQQLSIELKQLQQTQNRLGQEQQKTENQLPKLEEQLKRTSSSYHQLQTALNERNTIINALKIEVDSLQQQQDNIEQQYQQQQQQLADSTTQLAIANERIKEAGERLKQVDSKLDPERVLVDYLAHGHSLTEAKVRKLQADEIELGAKLNNMGPVNLAAAAELEAVNERLLPLEQQINDITASMATLTEAINSIDAKTKTLFLQTLDSVNESLTHLFTKVFGGGQASLTLIKEDALAKSEQWRAGLELMAQPKGKKNSRLAVLSGGEKTLTALSLIFAIFKQHPAPFCVLDEVDAPLDDANVMRFTNLITELADEVQFIFISHNKLAMQIADELKGVTMPQPGISSLVSVSLEEAENYLDPTA